MSLIVGRLHSLDLSGRLTEHQAPTSFFLFTLCRIQASQHLRVAAGPARTTAACMPPSTGQWRWHCRRTWLCCQMLLRTALLRAGAGEFVMSRGWCCAASMYAVLQPLHRSPCCATGRFVTALLSPVMTPAGAWCATGHSETAARPAAAQHRSHNTSSSSKACQSSCCRCLINFDLQMRPMPAPAAAAARTTLLLRMLVVVAALQGTAAQGGPKGRWAAVGQAWAPRARVCWQPSCGRCLHTRLAGRCLAAAARQQRRLVTAALQG